MCLMKLFFHTLNEKHIYLRRKDLSKYFCSLSVPTHYKIVSRHSIANQCLFNDDIRI